VSIIKALRRRYADRDIEVAIIGLSLLRDFPGVYGDPVEWLRNGGKVTLRALHNTRSGVLSMIERAKQAYWKQQNSRSKIQDRRNFERLGEVLRHTAQRAS
jgi:predicted ATP-grasp superfamily ATP-dependent carboligase